MGLSKRATLFDAAHCKEISYDKVESQFQILILNPLIQSRKGTKLLQSVVIKNCIIVLPYVKYNIASSTVVYKTPFPSYAKIVKCGFTGTRVDFEGLQAVIKENRLYLSEGRLVSYPNLTVVPPSLIFGSIRDTIQNIQEKRNLTLTEKVLWTEIKRTFCGIPHSTVESFCSLLLAAYREHIDGKSAQLPPQKEDASDLQPHSQLLNEIQYYRQANKDLTCLLKVTRVIDCYICTFCFRSNEYLLLLLLTDNNLYCSSY